MRGSFGDKVCDAEETQGSCHARQHGSTWNNELEDERSSVQLKLQHSYCYGIDVPALVERSFFLPCFVWLQLFTATLWVTHVVGKQLLAIGIFEVEALDNM